MVPPAQSLKTQAEHIEFPPVSKCDSHVHWVEIIYDDSAMPPASAVDNPLRH